MSNNKPIKVIPVDPQAYGLGILIGCLFQFWPYILGIVIVISLIQGVGSVIDGWSRQSNRDQILSQIDIVSLSGRYDEANNQFVVDYVLINRSKGVWDTGIGVELPVRYYDCQSAGTKAYGMGYGSPLRPSTQYFTWYPDETKQGTLGLDGTPRDYPADCKYEIEKPLLQVMDNP